MTILGDKKKVARFTTTNSRNSKTKRTTLTAQFHLVFEAFKNINF